VIEEAILMGVFAVSRNGREIGNKVRETLEEIGRGIPRPISWA